MPGGPRLFLFSLLFLLPPAAQSAPIPVLTVCDILRDPALYHHKTVIVVGALRDADQGSWLREDCDLTLTAKGRTWPTAISLSWSAREFAPPPGLPKHFQWAGQLLHQKLAVVRTTTRLAPKEEWLAVRGRIEARRPSGYGHNGYAPAQLVAPDDGYLHLAE